MRRLAAAVPVVGLAVLVVTWGRDLPGAVAAVVAVIHAAVVLVAVSHAEDIAHRVGEPLGTLVLAIAVTVIEVALIVTLMATEGPKAATLARDTVFAAVMIVCNGIVGVCLLANARRTHTIRFSEQGANALLGTVLTLATLSLVVPTFTSSTPGATLSAGQLAFSALASVVVYGIFVFVQTGRLRWMFQSTDDTGEVDEPHAPSRSLAPAVGLLIVSLVAVVGLAKTLAPSIEDAVVAIGAPQSFVGVVIALLVLLPEGVAAVRAARRSQMQTSLNLALGSALASIGLTIPSIAVASIWLDGPILLGLGGTEIVLLALTAAVSILTFGSGRATVLQATHHLAVFAAFIVLAIEP
ncbi:MAG: calcium:proton antiporter [Ilumatobacteraceae bacterium]